MHEPSGEKRPWHFGPPLCASCVRAVVNHSSQIEKMYAACLANEKAHVIDRNAVNHALSIWLEHLNDQAPRDVRTDDVHADERVADGVRFHEIKPKIGVATCSQAVCVGCMQPRKLLVLLVLTRHQTVDVVPCLCDGGARLAEQIDHRAFDLLLKRRAIEKRHVAVEAALRARTAFASRAEVVGRLFRFALRSIVWRICFFRHPRWRHFRLSARLLLVVVFVLLLLCTIARRLHALR